MIVGNASEEKIIHAVEHVCKAVPKGLSKKCKKFIEKHGKEIIKLLVSNVLPKEVCKTIQLCNTKIVPVLSKDIGSAKCELCKKILKEIENLIVDKPTEDKIINAVHHVCKAVPKILSKECDKFIDEHGAEIIKLLESNVLPKEICKMLQLCRDANKLSKDVDSSLCPLCKLILEQVKNLRPVNVTKVEIYKTLQQICNTTPFLSDCHQFITKYGADIAHLLKHLVEPNQICELLPACSAKMEMALFEVHTCAVCKIALHNMNNLFQNPNVNQSQENVLKKTCESLPTEYQEQCQNMMIYYGDELYRISSEAVNPNVACSDTGLCYKNELVGSNKCTWGPSYWCINKATAMECGMTSHCQQNIWADNKQMIST